jgi:DNA-binding transcriptional MerR regulator
MFTIDYIAKDMGFTIPFVRKCLKQMDAVFKNCYKKGEFNRIYFNQNGYVVFDQIKQLRATGLKIEAIKTHLENQLKHSQTPSFTDINTEQTAVNQIPYDLNIINKLFEEKEARLKDKEESQERIRELEQLAEHLQGKLLYLTDGRTPEEVKQQWQLDKARISAILKELEELDGIFSNLKYMKRKKLYKELQGLMSKQSAENPLQE